MRPLVLLTVGAAQRSRLGLLETQRFAALSGDGMATTTAEERAEAAAMKRGATGSVSSAAALDLPSVVLEMGVQKYVLIRAGDQHFVRGSLAAAYHKDAARPTVNELRTRGVDYEVLGGGRIRADPDDKSILVYGKKRPSLL